MACIRALLQKKGGPVTGDAKIFHAAPIGVFQTPWRRFLKTQGYSPWLHSPAGRKRIAERFNAGWGLREARVRAGTAEWVSAPSRLDNRFLSSLRDLEPFLTDHPALSYWAMVGRPYGSEKTTPTAVREPAQRRRAERDGVRAGAEANNGGVCRGSPQGSDVDDSRKNGGYPG